MALSLPEQKHSLSISCKINPRANTHRGSRAVDEKRQMSNAGAKKK